MVAIIKTFSGRRVDMSKFTKDDIDLRDISFSLSRQRRYAGHTAVPWSVGQHSILCSMLCNLVVEDEKAAASCFIHDVEETWVQDIIHPIKHNYAMVSYDKMCHSVSKIVYDFFGLKDSFADKNTQNLVKAIDQTAYYFEANQLFPFTTEEDFGYFDENMWTNVNMIRDSGFYIPNDLIEMSDDDVAQELFEVLNVLHAEKALGGKIDPKFYLNPSVNEEGNNEQVTDEQATGNQT